LEPQGYVLQITGKDAGVDGLAAAYDVLKAQCLAESLWFGWRETELCLPRHLKNTTKAFDPRWDVERIFTQCAELRAQRRGDARLILLLTENVAVAQQVKNDLGATCHNFKTVEEGHRILAGKKPTNPIKKGSQALIEVAYPRELDYDVGTVLPEQMLVADVRCYYDGLRRLKFVRYCKISPKKIGSVEVKPL
jgi:hypothetical protein